MNKLLKVWIVLNMIEFILFNLFFIIRSLCNWECSIWTRVSLYLTLKFSLLNSLFFTCKVDLCKYNLCIEFCRFRESIEFWWISFWYFCIVSLILWVVDKEYIQLLLYSEIRFILWICIFWNISNEVVRSRLKVLRRFSHIHQTVFLQ